jgi:hypothetical protein
MPASTCRTRENCKPTFRESSAPIDKGFSLRLKADLKAGDNLIIRTNKGGN